MRTYDAHKSTTEVRQGSRRLTNFRVLIISTILTIAALGLVFAIYTVVAPGNGM